MAVQGSRPPAGEGATVAVSVPPELAAVAGRYAVAITPEMQGLIDPADRADPIARQFLPSAAELDARPDELADPIGDDAHSPVTGIVHRYPDRVLLKPVQICAVYCRFCFRRETVGPGGGALTPAQFAAALDYIRARPAIWEVILTGGDPFMLAPRRLAEIMASLDAIPHLGVIRIHTRIPVVAPGRVTAELVDALHGRDKAVWVSIHANHPRELTPAALTALRTLSDAGLPLLGQTVLLKGVNDDPEVLESLFRALVRARVKPYYLHHGDRAPGTAHFRTGLEHGQALMRALRGHVSGLCQPTYVLDLPGGHGKVPAGPCLLDGSDAEGWRVEDRHGGRHDYPGCTDRG